MIIRFYVSNYLSFGELTEFNLVTGDVRTKRNHVESIKGVDVLKFSLLYGPNGAGKSNFVRSVKALRDLVVKKKKIEPAFYHGIHKFSSQKDKPIIFEIEFKTDSEKVFVYGVAINKTCVENEYLYYSGLLKGKDKLIFERTSSKREPGKIEIGKEFIKDRKDKDFVDLFESSILGADELVLSKIIDFPERLSAFNLILRNVILWFQGKLRIIHPDSKPADFLYIYDQEKSFQQFSSDLLSQLDIGIKNLYVKSFDLEEYYGRDNMDLLYEIKDRLETVPFISSDKDMDIIVMKKPDHEGEYVVKKLFVVHEGNEEEIHFSIEEESDGTRRLIEYLIILYDILNPELKGVYIIDEMERSIHPHLLKELLKVMTDSEEITGQLIFTTHESHLMDLNMFRQDEIWLTEKNDEGATTFSVLSDFKIRNDLDIRKGYLKGRFGAIPILANLQDLKWVDYAAD